MSEKLQGRETRHEFSGDCNTILSEFFFFQLKTIYIYYFTVLEVRNMKWVSLNQNEVIARVALLQEALRRIHLLPLTS